MPTSSRAVTTYDFNTINLTIYSGQQSLATTLSPQQCIMLAQQLLTNALLCQSHERSVSSSASTVTTSPSQTAAISEETAEPAVPLASAKSA